MDITGRILVRDVFLVSKNRDGVLLDRPFTAIKAVDVESGGDFNFSYNPDDKQVMEIGATYKLAGSMKAREKNYLMQISLPVIKSLVKEVNK